LEYADFSCQGCLFWNATVEDVLDTAIGLDSQATIGVKVVDNSASKTPKFKY